MPIEKEIQDYIEKYIQLLISQTNSYLPFIKVAYPLSKNLEDACFSLIAGNALSMFINQYSMRLKYPTISDFEDFGKITLKYKEQIDKFFK